MTSKPAAWAATTAARSGAGRMTTILRERVSIPSLLELHAASVNQGGAPFFAHHLDCARQHRGKFARAADEFAIAAEGFDHLVVARLGAEPHQWKILVAYRPSFGMYTPRGMIDRAPAAVVVDDSQGGQLARRRDQMASRRGGEQVAAVPLHQNYRLFGRAQLDSQRSS